jgi:hypothetical protein
MGALVESSGNGNSDTAGAEAVEADGTGAGVPAVTGTATGAGAGAGTGGGTATVFSAASDRQPTSATPRPAIKTQPETRSIKVFTAINDGTEFMGQLSECEPPGRQLVCFCHTARLIDTQPH